MVNKIFENKKHVFWQAFFVTLLFFLIGLVLGVYLEQIRSDNLSVTYSQSEISLYDSFALSKLSDTVISCSDLIEANINFADRIYEEAAQLEKYDEKSKLTEAIKSIHRKYDLLRTFLWINIMDLKTKCPGITSVVYIYTYDTENIDVKSEQIVWERILNDLKLEKGNDIILIPIAEDSNLASLNSLINEFNITKFPAVIIGDKQVLHQISSVKDLEKYL